MDFESKKKNPAVRHPKIASLHILWPSVSFCVGSILARRRRRKEQFLFAGTLFVLFALLGCSGGSTSQKQDPIPTDFSLVVGPSTITVIPGGTAQAITVFASPVNGFTGTVTVTVGSLPSGVTATPSSLTLPIGSQGQFNISASSTAAPGTASVAIAGTSGSLAHSSAASLTVAAPVTSASLSTTAYDFGNNLINNTLTQTVVIVTNTGQAMLTMNPSLSGDPSYSIASNTSCGQQLAAGANCSVVLKYTPTSASAPSTQNATLNMGFGGVQTGTPQSVAITGTASVLPAGQVTATDNPQVALYTMTLPFPGKVTINFGPDTNYGLKTWTQATDPSGKVSIFVAGMRAVTTYHMQAAVNFSNGIAANDVDHVFTTKAVPANMQLNVSTTTTTGMTPQPGLELLNPIAGNPSGVMVTDLSGNVLWAYANPGNPAVSIINGVKMLPNGNLLMAIGYLGVPSGPQVPAATINEIREVNLAGDTVREITINDLNSALVAASCSECHVTLTTFHHDVEALPNGHWLVLADTVKALSSTSSPALTNAPAMSVLGDVVIDLDQNLQPVWVWNGFNHLDPNRHLMGLPDWTHANAVLYSKDDGNFLISLRHQNWILKVNYANGSGDGSTVWRLGGGGDFTLQGGTDPTDWQYAQHGPAFFSPNTSGTFSLGALDNGNDRIFPAGITCGASGAPPCLYSTVPVWKIDEFAKTATLTFHQILPPSLYSNFAGNVGQLLNGNVEYDLANVNSPGLGSYVYEATQESNPQTVWSMRVNGTFLYRAFRIPSFYPGVQW